jgi:hypothetical protein
MKRYTGFIVLILCIAIIGSCQAQTNHTPFYNLPLVTHGSIGISGSYTDTAGNDGVNGALLRIAYALHNLSLGVADTNFAKRHSINVFTADNYFTFGTYRFTLGSTSYFNGTTMFDAGAMYPPFEVGYANKVANLNADQVDDAHASVTPTANVIPIAGSDHKLDTGWVTIPIDTNIAKRHSNNVFTADNYFSTGLTRFSGITDFTGTASFNAGALYPPFVVTYANKVVNLNADQVDDAHASQTPTAYTIPIAGADHKLDTGWVQNVGGGGGGISQPPLFSFYQIATKDSQWYYTAHGNITVDSVIVWREGGDSTKVNVYRNRGGTIVDMFPTNYAVTTSPTSIPDIQNNTLQLNDRIYVVIRVLQTGTLRALNFDTFAH